MARWRLLNPHYLNVPGTEWEYIEVSRQTGKQARVRYPVGLLLDPKDPNDHNYPGEIIVADKPSTNKRDIVFIGPPTPDMEPIDDEAEKISERMKATWKHPIESLEGYGDYSQSLLKKFDDELTAAIQRVGGVPKAAQTSAIRAEDFEILKRQVADLTRQNAELLARTKAQPVK